MASAFLGSLIFIVQGIAPTFTFSLISKTETEYVFPQVDQYKN